MSGGITYAAFRHVVGIMHDVSGQTKVTDLHDFPLRQEDISSSQVPVDALHGKGKQQSVHLSLDNVSPM